jgi:hypothetical protein
MVERSQNPDITKTELSDITQVAFDAYLNDHNRDVPFKEVLEHVVEVAFHEGGDSSSDLVWALMNEVDKGVLRDPIVDCMRDAVDQGYTAGKSGKELFDMDEATSFLRDYLEQLPPGAKVTDAINTLISEGLTLEERSFGPLLNINKDFTTEWILTPPVMQMLENHYKRLVREHIPVLYAKEIEDSPVEHIQSRIRGDLVSFREGVNKDGDVNVVLSFSDPAGKLKALIFSFLNATDETNHSFDRFRAYFMHALEETKRHKGLPGDSYSLGILDVSFWDQWLKPTWKQALKQYNTIIKTRPNPKRDAIVAANESKAKARQLQMIADGEAPARKKASTRKKTPVLYVDNTVVAEAVSSDPENQVIAYNFSGGKRLLCRIYRVKNSNTIGYALTLEYPVSVQEEPNLVRVHKNKNIKPLKLVAGDSGELVTIRNVIYGRLGKFDISRREINDIPLRIFTALRGFAREFVKNPGLS